MMQAPASLPQPIVNTYAPPSVSGRRLRLRESRITDQGRRGIVGAALIPDIIAPIGSSTEQVKSQSGCFRMADDQPCFVRPNISRGRETLAAGGSGARGRLPRSVRKLRPPAPPAPPRGVDSGAGYQVPAWGLPTRPAAQVTATRSRLGGLQLP